jgi:uncharacterized membrane protein HdeD (DUF308 family)
MRSAAHPSTALRLIAGVAVVLLGVTVSVNPAGTIAALTLAAAAYALILVEVARAARDRRHGTALGATALVVGVLAALLFPLTWSARARSPRWSRCRYPSPGSGRQVSGGCSPRSRC